MIFSSSSAKINLPYSLKCAEGSAMWTRIFARSLAADVVHFFRKMLTRFVYNMVILICLHFPVSVFSLLAPLAFLLHPPLFLPMPKTNQFVAKHLKIMVPESRTDKSLNPSTSPRIFDYSFVNRTMISSFFFSRL